MRKYILNAAGDPEVCDDVVAWGKWFESAGDVRRVARDEVGGVSVSTVFLGLDHAWNSSVPVLFETMIFGGPHDQYQERYSTRVDALEGHAVALAMVRASAPPDPSPENPAP